MQIKNSIAAQSLLVFGQQLMPDPRSDIKLIANRATDIDTLLTGPSLHVHVERKRKVISESEVSGVILQMMETEKSYKLLRHHIVGDTVCDFKQVIYAESMEPVHSRNSCCKASTC